MKKLFLDLETTGPWKNRHGIRQISALLDVKDEPLIVFDRRINPDTKYEWDEYVLENMATPEEYFDDPTGEEVFVDLKIMLEEYVDPYNTKDKYFLYGYNVSFDADFLRQFFYDQGDKYFGSWFFTPPIDIMTMAAERLKDVRPNMPNFKLETVANFLGLEVNPDKLHDSLYDIELTKQIYDKLTDEQKTQ